MKISEALTYAKQKLGSDKSRASLTLLGEFLGLDRTKLILYEHETMRDFESFKAWVQDFANDEPLEYITGKVSFYSRDFEIERGVLIPRPETEILVDKTDKLIKANKLANILEIGTGSGIISIMLKLLNPNLKMKATDINSKAVQLAQKNALLHRAQNIEFIETDLDKNVEGKFDLLVSNPPYIASNIKLEAHVLKEPLDALFSGVEGLDMLKKLVLIVKKRDIKYLACEISYDQKEKINEFLRLHEVMEVEFYKDLSFHDRGFVAKFF